MEKTVRKTSLHNQEDHDVAYWRRQSPAVRIEAVTFLIQQVYGPEHEVSERFPRVLAVARRPLR